MGFAKKKLTDIGFRLVFCKDLDTDNWFCKDKGFAINQLLIQIYIA